MSLYVPTYHQLEPSGFVNPREEGPSFSAFYIPEYPVIITESERETVNFPHFCSLLDGRLLSPLQSLGHHVKEVDPVVENVDRAYREAIYRYSQSLQLAVRRDLIEINRLEEERKFTVATHTSGGAALGVLGGALVVGSAGTALLGGFLLGLFCFITSQSKKMEYIQRHGCVNRFSWMQHVDADENRRLNDSVDALRLRSIQLANKILKSDKKGVINLEALGYLKQVLTVLHVLSKGESPTQPINPYYLELQKSHPQLITYEKELL